MYVCIYIYISMYSVPTRPGAAAEAAALLGEEFYRDVISYYIRFDYVV